jgi:hypothetical protein
MRQFLSDFRNCSSEVLCCREYFLSVVRHTRSSTGTLRLDIPHRSRGSIRVVAQSRYADDRFRACRIGGKIL